MISWSAWLTAPHLAAESLSVRYSAMAKNCVIDEVHRSCGEICQVLDGGVLEIGSLNRWRE